MEKTQTHFHSFSWDWHKDIGVTNMISNSSKHFLKIQWLRMMLDDKKWETCTEALQMHPWKVFRSQVVAWGLIPEASAGTCGCSMLTMSFGHRRRGTISDSMTKSRGLLQRLGMVNEINQLPGCKGLGGQGMRTPRLWHKELRSRQPCY